MFGSRRTDAPDIERELAQQRQWITDAIAATKTEITEIERQIKCREPITRQQNADLQDAFTRYMDLTKSRCKKEVDKIMARAAELAIVTKLDEMERKAAAVRGKQDEVDREIEESRKLAEGLEEDVEKLRRMVGMTENHAKAKIANVSEIRARRIAGFRAALIAEKMKVTRQKREESRQMAERKFEEEDAMEKQEMSLMEKEIGETAERVNRMVEAICTLEKNIMIAIHQNPRPVLSLEHFNTVSIEPVGRKTSTAFDNIVILAPRNLSGRRPFRMNEPSFGSTPFFARPWKQ